MLIFKVISRSFIFLNDRAELLLYIFLGEQNKLRNKDLFLVPVLINTTSFTFLYYLSIFLSLALLKLYSAKVSEAYSSNFGT